ncbi:SDR family oxidoreductase [Nocardioides albus]|uniref:NAD(P)-dependent dehydrogenase (Short-subunit alcohol dehydrogenase family) n=1 Tax=Nocardioides albus TaxID=1841 RepID=A0A7W5A3F0_9ACTN|nr:SDR family oxidoreductase [Nocardioides albus]MBB3088981.1 NAD(P)-dependent dehydrogenase (short-subunit alcohol dehydrogenase family) [Nocardioides albus]GGU15038.1 putative short chain dehydrogenase/reductase [Nocardioides albus]
MQVKDKVAIVTGAAGGIGAALATGLVEAGAKVVLTDRSPAVEQTAKELDAAHPGSALGLTGDAADTDDIAAAIALAESKLGPVDLYFANAGVGGGGGLGATHDEWKTAIDVNVLAHVRAAQQLVPRWVERGSGYFVSTASAAGLLTQIGSATYSVTKHGAVAFAEWLAITYGNSGVNVSCLCPMGVNTAMLTGGTDTPTAAERKAAAAVINAGGVLDPSEVAGHVLAAVEAETFLILPHAEVLEFWRRKSSDYDRWLAGMRRYQDSLA